MMYFIINLLLKMRMKLVNYRAFNPLKSICHNPVDSQNDLLLKIINSHKETQFGKDHNFSRIQSYDDYIKNVDIMTYDDLAPYIEKEMSGEKYQITTEEAAFYATTSGSTGSPKYLPILNGILNDFKEDQSLQSYSFYKALPNIYTGKILAITSPAIEGHLENGKEYGSMSGLIQQSMPSLTKKKYIIPYEVLELRDYNTKYILIGLCCLIESNISFIATANPSTLIKINDVMKENWENFKNFIKTSRFDDIESGNEEIEEYILNLRLGNQKYCDEIASCQSFEEASQKMWKNLNAVSTWTGGSCAVALKKAKGIFPTGVRFFELGYIASEFRGSLPVDPIKDLAIPTIHRNFFEFVEKKNWEDKINHFLTIDQIKKGSEYYIFATTQNGLYRYNINDIIKVTGKWCNTPTIAFLQKGQGVTNITGEKLYEMQVQEAYNMASIKLGLALEFFILLANPEEQRYICMIEDENLDMDEFVTEIDQNLREMNIEYESKRMSGRLHLIKAFNLKKGTQEKFKEYLVNSGQREGQLKIPMLEYINKWNFSFKDMQREKESNENN